MSIIDPPELRLIDTDFGRPSKSKTTSRSAANNGLRPNINAVITNTEQGEEEEEGDVDVAPRRAGFFHLVVKYYWIAFGTVLCLELLAVLLSAIFSINNKLFPLDFMQVPVEIKTEKTYIRDLAFELRLQDPHLIIPEDEKKFYLPYAQAVDDLSLIYRGDNVLTKECLQAIRDVELWMTNSTVWQNHGLTDNVGNVLKPDSIIRFFDGTHRTDLNDTEFRDIPNTLFRAYSDRQLKATLQTFLAKDAVISSTEARSGLTRSVFILGVARTPDYRLKTFWTFYDDIGQQVKCDSSLAWGSMLFVLLFVFLQTQSIFITTMGMASIGFSFLWANYIYRVVLDYRYFGIFHIVSIFLILGTGSDNLFVFYDMWRTTACMDLDTVERRFAYSYKRASLSMLLTSLTTAIALASNAFIPLYSISSFAVFSSLLVMITYLSAIFFFPMCVLVYHLHIERLMWPWQMSFLPSAEGDPQRRRPNMVVRFFKGPFYRFVTHNVLKWLLVLGTTTLALLSAVVASRLDISASDIQYYRDGFNYREAQQYERHGFMRWRNDPRIQIYLLFGVKGVDMSRCQAYDYNCLGVPVFDESLDLNPVPVQRALLRICRDLRHHGEEKELHLARVENSTRVQLLCFLDNMNTFFKRVGSDARLFPGRQEYTALPVTALKYLRLAQAEEEAHNVSGPPMYGPNIRSGDFYRFFETAVSYWLTNGYRGVPETGTGYTHDVYLARVLGLSNDSPDLDRIYKEQNTYYGAKLRFFYIVVNTNLVYGQTDFRTGLAAYEAWETLTTRLMSKLPASCQGFQVSSSHAWHNFKVSEALEMSAIRGIILGTILCLVVLTLATYNILVSMLATINILFVIATFTGCLYLSGYKISMVESVNLSLVAGLAVDYVVHLSESYYQAPHDKRQRRVRDMLEHMGISVLSGSITTAGASAFLLHSHMFFFFQFGLFVLVTIFLSVFYCLFWFTPMLGLVGPEGDVGSLEPAFRWIARTLESLPKTSASSVRQRKISYSRSSSYNVSARAKTSSSGVLRRGV